MNVWKCKLIFPTDTLPQNIVITDLKPFLAASNHYESESDVTYGQVWLPILGIHALHLIHPKCTDTAVSTHPEQWAAIYAAAPGEQLGVQCLAQGHLSRGIEGGREC